MFITATQNAVSVHQMEIERIKRKQRGSNRNWDYQTKTEDQTKASRIERKQGRSNKSCEDQTKTERTKWKLKGPHENIQD